MVLKNLIKKYVCVYTYLAAVLLKQANISPL